MRSSAPLPSYAPEEPTSRILRFGTAVGLSAFAALVCALPAAFRVSAAAAGTDGSPRVLVALSAAALGPMLGSILVLRGAREGLRAFAGPGQEFRAYGVFLWIGSLFTTFSLLGSLLRAKTHHHALAGVTFAFAALALAVVSALLCARIVAVLRGVPVGAARALAGALGAAVVAAAVWIGLRFFHAVAHDPDSASAATVVVDVLAFALSAGFAARPSFADRRALALVGPPIAVTILALGASALRHPPIRTAIEDRAPVYSAAVDWIPGFGG